MESSFEHIPMETQKLIQGLKKLEEEVKLVNCTDNKDVSNNREGNDKNKGDML